MGLDVGTKTVGVAISDELGITAQGVKTVRRSNLKSDLKELQTLIDENQVNRVVVGLPLNMDGSEGLRAVESRKFGAALEERCQVPVEYWGERLSTVAAERVLLEADVSRKKRREVIDQMAASIILQAWLDAKSSASTDWEPE
jgi:putative Holliday junction resolvase